MTCVVATFTAEGFHRWPEAPAHRAYLADRHRHLFHVRVEVEVGHGDREIECHDLRDFALEAFGAGDMGCQSCEMMAVDLAQKVARRFGDRRVMVEVLEDGEVGGRFQSGECVSLPVQSISTMEPSSRK
jgi:hypothetical protein